MIEQEFYYKVFRIKDGKLYWLVHRPDGTIVQRSDSPYFNYYEVTNPIPEAKVDKLPEKSIYITDLQYQEEIKGRMREIGHGYGVFEKLDEAILFAKSLKKLYKRFPTVAVVKVKATNYTRHITNDCWDMLNIKLANISYPCFKNIEIIEIIKEYDLTKDI